MLVFSEELTNFFYCFVELLLVILRVAYRHIVGFALQDQLTRLTYN
nr:MAG TPA: hypothetical protein [Caudoviricetes sp.]DAU59076.1 MAG TPA: hypothetical protein [Caudoviricetes sp.]